MALTKVSGGILDPGIDVAGIVTATGFDGPFTGGSGSNITAGIVTCTELDLNGSGNISGNLIVEGNLTANGDFTTLNTTLREVEILRVDADTTAIAGIITQRGTGDIFSAYDTSTEVFKITDGGFVSINEPLAVNGLTINKSGDYSHSDGNTYYQPVGKWLSAWGQVNLDDGEDHWVGFTGKYGNSSASVNISLAPNFNNLTQQAGVYIAGEATSDTTSDFTVGKIVSGDTLGQATSGNKRATKSELFRITSAGQVQINTDGGSGALTLGASQDFRLYHDAGGPTIFSDTGNQGLKLQIKELNLTEYTGTTTKLKIDSSYRILKGLTTARGNFANNTSGVQYAVQIEGTSAVEAGLSIIRNSNDVNDGGIVLGKTRSTSNGGNDAVIAGDDLGNITFAGSDGTTLQFGAEIFAEVQSGVGNDDLPTDLIFKTNGGSTSTAERLRITSAGQVSISGAGTTFGVAKLNIAPANRTTAFDASDGDTWHDVVIKQSASATTNSVGIAFEISPSTYHKNAGTGIVAIKDGNNFDYGTHLAFITRPHTAVAEERLRITSGGDLKLPDNAKIELGGAQTGAGDLEIYYDGTDGFINQKNNALKIQHNGTLKSYFGSNTLNLQDDYKLGLGTNNNFTIHNDGNNSLITDSSSAMFVRSNRILFQNSGGTEGYGEFNQNGSVYWTHDNIKRIETTATGIEVTGEVAATQDYPDFRPTLDFNFAAEKKLDPRITYQRTGPASFVNEFGKVVLVGDNAPRFDHDPTTRESKGLLIEDSRTNLLKYSVDFASIPGYQENYSNARSTLTSTTEVAPDGTNTASKYVRTAGQGTGEVAIIIGNTLGLSSGTVYTSSIFVKNVGTNNILEFVNVRASSANSDSQFNLALGTITTEGSENTLTTITPYPNDWYRISVTATMNNASGYFWIRMYNQPEGDGFIIWGGQVEAGAFPTSYIPTHNNASVSRGGDYVGITGDEHTDFWNTTEGTYLIDYKPLERAIGDGVIIGSKRGTQGSGYPWPLYRHDTANTNIFKSYDNDNGIVTISSAWEDRRESWALGFNGTNGSIARNGSQLVTNNTNMTGLINANELWLGSSGTGSMYSMHVKRFMYYRKRITDSQLKTLTS